MNMYKTSQHTGPGRPTRRALALAVLALSVGACDESPTAGPEAPFVPAALELDRQSVRAESLGEEIRIQAFVTDASGQPGTSVQVEWSAEDAQILESLGDGRFLSVGNGETAVRARVQRNGADALEAGAQVEVDQVAVEVAVLSDPDADAPLETLELWSVGQDLEVLAAPRDAMGARIAEPEHTLQWETDDPGVATVDQAGRIEAQGAGTTSLRARYGSFAAALELVVSPSLELQSCVRFDVDPQSAQEGETCAALSLAFSERDTVD